MTLVLALALVVPACAPGDGAEDGLTVFAAASLRTVTDELASAWAEAYPDVPLAIATEASNVLAAQIEEGAGADVFIAADDVHAQRLADLGYTAADPVPFARNEVALVASPDGPVGQVADLTTPGTRLVVGGPSTPIGRYTALAIASLARTTPDATTFAAAVEANIASREDNVRAALAKVELGEGDAAFVYRTDAIGSEAVRSIALPPAARVSALYSAVQVSERPAASEFIDWLFSPVVAQLLSEAGFEAVT